MKKTLTRLLLLSLMLVVSCSTVTTRVFPHDDGTHLMVATAVSDSEAMDGALDKSKEFCASQGKQMKVLSQKSSYHGMDKNAQGAINTLGMMTNHYEVYGATHNADDHKIEMTFRCR